MIKKLLLSIFAISLLACNQGVEKPDNLIDRETFKRALTQMYLYKQAPNLSVSREIDFNAISAAILDKYHLSAEDFRKSLEYYMASPELYKDILQEIQDSIRNNIDRSTEEKPSMNIEQMKKMEQKITIPNQ
ncbi:DUF4296 domain-containing protein [Ornithobacterium rhinotracheale]|uniref:DUF4296 domain-containing protein n=1 Tax=Ornithobacterium rhinotracheale TaxID=28251 RepID=A0A410JU26_ORNRH|nr:DUF4296 domain-containing protein [Ornithobacterium rhinotracheale]QAR31704.1 DUF4296 domain-containing protein [Ornithobacterium rhinotracheale]